MTIRYTEAGGRLMFTAGASVSTKKPLRGRRLIAVDIENVVGGAAISSGEVSWAKAALQNLVEIEPPDQVVITTSHVGLLTVGCAWPNLRYVVGTGPNGADEQLLAVLAEDIPRRFDDVVLVSGDGIFAPAVAHLVAAGVTVEVVAHPDGLSARLRLAASRVSYIPRRDASAGVLEVAA